MGGRPRDVTIACVLVLAVLGAAPGPAHAASPRVAVGSVSRVPAGARVGARVSAARRLSLTVALAPRDPLAMQTLATAVATPTSPEYRHYLTVGDFARRFGAGAARIATVSHALRIAGLSVSAPTADGLSLTVSGTVGRVQAAFRTRLAAVRLPGGRRALADRSTPTLPAGLAPDVDAVIGLDTLSRPDSDERAAVRSDIAPAHLRGAVLSAQACAAATRAAADPSYPAYTEGTIADAYGFGGLTAAGADGAGQTVAVFELEKVRHADISAYAHCYGLHAHVSYVDVGHPRWVGNDGEAALDIEQILGLAPGAHLIVYQSGDSDADSVANYARIVSQNRAKVISISWGSCERVITEFGTDYGVVRAENHLFQEAALQGQSVVSAAGDTGSSGCEADDHSHSLAVQDPSSQPFATAVGGTTLYTEAAGKPAAWNPALTADPLLESVWNDGVQRTGDGRQPEATGGGVSRLWRMPAYQRRAATTLGVHNADSSGAPCRSSGDCREVPDVSADGDPALGYVVYLTADGEHGWTAVGGTSAAAPVWAALAADADSLPACRGAHLGFLNPALYELAATQPADFRDVTGASPFSGRADNDALGSGGGLYPVTAGYDMTTGLGVPDAAALGAGLCGLRAPVYSVTLAPLGLHPAVAGAGYRLALRGVDSGGLRLRYRAEGLPRGLTISSRRGVISGRARHPGSYRVRITAEDHATNRATIRLRLRVLTPAARISQVRLSGVTRRRPHLSFTATRGRGGPDLGSVTVQLPAGLSIGRRGAGIHAGGVAVRTSVSHLRGTLTLRLGRPRGELQVTLEPPSLIASGRLARLARAHRDTRVQVRISATDRTRRSTRRGFRLRLG